MLESEVLGYEVLGYEVLGYEVLGYEVLGYEALEYEVLMTWKVAGSKPVQRLNVAAGLLLSLCMGSAVTKTGSALQNIVFYYGDHPATEQLQQFDMAVVEPDTIIVPPTNESDTRWFAYVSVGEVGKWRAHYTLIPDAWIIGRNTEWQSEVVDQTAEGWPEFFVEHVITPLWERGYTGFFLDTLDSYLLVSPSELDKQKSRAGLIAVIQAIRTQYPTAQLILNRGFELLPAVHEAVYAVAFESLFKGWSEARGQYVDVPADDRQWLLNRAREIKKKYDLPVIAIDYCAPAHTHCSRETIKQIRALGMIPYVGDGRLQQVNFAGLE